MYPSIPGAFEPFESTSFGGGSIWDPSPPIPNLAPKADSLTSSRPYRKIAKPFSRSETFARPSHPASYDSYSNDASSKRRKRGPSELNDDLADDNYVPSVKSAANGGTMPSTGLKVGVKRDLNGEDSDDEGGLKESYFSDTSYRRNCGSSTHESDDRGGKRRLLNVVGSVVGSIWEFCTSQMPNSLAGIIPKIGWSTAAAEYYDTPFNAPPGLFDGDEFHPENAEFVKPSIPGTFVPSFSKPTLKSIIPPSPAREENDPFRARSPDYSLMDEDMSRSRMGGMDSPMSASWILVKPESTSRASSPVPTSPSAGASAASMRRSGSNTGSGPNTPIFSAPQVSGMRRQTGYARPVPSRKMRGVARPTGYYSGSRSGMFSRSSTGGSSNGSNFSLSSSQSTLTSNFSQPSFGSFGGASMASSITSVGSMPTSPVRTGASAAGQRARGATVSGASGASGGSTPRRKMDEDDDMAQMDIFSKQLRAMIREGKEALGSKVEVYDCDDEQDWM
ncbi:hypothetical protein ABW19_dt0203244 [Dactylella cylindrospora]|nr:hypothetical protein ABW19_dt0203244 [Dactylella cylindrospora]